MRMSWHRILSVVKKKKIVKRINCVDSRKKSQLKAAKHKDAASASGKAAATGTWR